MDIVELAKQATTVPDDFGWYGRQDMFITWGWAGVDMNRDSDILAISNYHSVIATLKSEYGDEYDENFDEVRVGHWAVGHVDRLIVKVYDHAICKHCHRRIDFQETNIHTHTWDWLDIDGDATCGDEGEIVHEPSDNITEDQITEHFKRVMDIVFTIREWYPIWDESDFSEREYQAEVDLVDFVCKDVLHVSDDFDAGEVLSWLNDNDYSSEGYDSDGTPLWDRNDLAIGIYMTHMEDADYSDPDDFWRGWQEKNVNWVRRRIEDDMAKAGQEKMF